jgi:hypothetical protein
MSEAAAEPRPEEMDEIRIEALNRRRGVRAAFTQSLNP